MSHNESQQQNNNVVKGKKSIALAVSLVILVASAMLNVLLSTKNMGYGQAQKVDIGEHIISYFSLLNEKDELLVTYSSSMRDYMEDEAGLVRLTASHTIPVVDDLKAALGNLIELAQTYNKGTFTTGLANELNWLQQIQDELSMISSQDGKLTQQEFDQISAINEGSEHLYELINSFNFNVAGNKNAMIRLGNGFDWIEQVQAIERFVNVEAIQ